jgi:hypothetical protein
MNERIKQLADEAAKYSAVMALPTGQSGNELFVAKLAELIIRECLNIVKSNTYGPCGEYDYGYSDKNAAADKRAEDIYEDIAYRFGIEK